MIKVSNLSKEFKVHKKAPGFFGSLRSLVKRDYIIKKALDNINLEINDGEIIGLIGSNGAGKTTLTKILSGIIDLTQGSVEVNGFNPWDRDNKYRSQMSLIMGQKAQLWWDLPALDGFLLLKEIYRIPDEQYHETINYLAKTLQIEEELNVQVRKLSLGERMKVELMAALLHQPKIVFLDEPTIGLDLTAQKSVRQFIKDYRKRFKTTMILTSHYMDDIEQLCDRVAIMKEGKIIYDGALKQLKDKHSHLKKIHANLNLESIDLLKGSPLDPKFGSYKINNEVLEINCPNLHAMECATNLLQDYKATDLNIAGEDISSIIESILNSREN